MLPGYQTFYRAIKYSAEMVNALVGYEKRTRPIKSPACRRTKILQDGSEKTIMIRYETFYTSGKLSRILENFPNKFPFC